MQQQQRRWRRWRLSDFRSAPRGGFQLEICWKTEMCDIIFAGFAAKNNNNQKKKEMTAPWNGYP